RRRPARPSDGCAGRIARRRPSLLTEPLVLEPAGEYPDHHASLRAHGPAVAEDRADWMAVGFDVLWQVTGGHPRALPRTLLGELPRLSARWRDVGGRRPRAARLVGRSLRERQRKSATRPARARWGQARRLLSTACFVLGQHCFSSAPWAPAAEAQPPILTWSTGSRRHGSRGC